MSSLVVPNARLKNHHVGLPVYLHGEEQVEKKRKEEAEVEVVRRRNGFCLGREEVAAESSESSSIGAPSSSSSSSSSEEEGSRREGREAKEEEVESKRKDGAALGSLDSLEDSLPIKQASFRAIQFLLREVEIICELIRRSHRERKRHGEARKPLQQTQETPHAEQH
ncbi:unnamed protein product [Musa textilis]